MPTMIKHFVLDVDGVFTDGRFYYTTNGKSMKAFGPHDADGIKLIRDKVAIQLISADRRGFHITNARAEDMGLPLTLVSEEERYSFVEKLGFDQTIFMGDGFHDAPVLEKVILGIAPNNACDAAKESADFVTKHRGGDGAVLEACLYLKEYYL